MSVYAQETPLEGCGVARKSSWSYQVAWDLDAKAISCTEGGREEMEQTYMTSLRPTSLAETVSCMEGREAMKWKERRRRT
jgi:hypothetical protein